MIEEFLSFGNSAVHTYASSDGYLLHYRSWGNEAANDIVVMLHGGVSHSGWQYPLGVAFTKQTTCRFIAVDRRGSGLNRDGRGHLVSVEQELKDVVILLRELAGNGRNIHLAGWCFGGQIASLVAAHPDIKGHISSLIMITPGFRFTERYGDILVRATHSVKQVLKNIQFESPRDIDYFPVPLAVEDFTDDEALQKLMEADDLLLRNVTMNTIDVWQELADLSRSELISSAENMRVLCILANEDRLVNNQEVAEYLQRRYGDNKTEIIWLSGHHAIQFTAAEQIVNYIHTFIR